MAFSINSATSLATYTNLKIDFGTLGGGVITCKIQNRLFYGHPHPFARQSFGIGDVTVSTRNA